MKKTSCENCQRSADCVEISTLSIDGHVAKLCVMCHRVLAQENQHLRFFTLVRRNHQQSSNIEMQKIHRRLSLLLLVGLFFIACVSGFAIFQHMDLLQAAPIEAYATFAELNRM